MKLFWRSLEDKPLFHGPKILTLLWIITLAITLFTKWLPYTYIVWLSFLIVLLLLFMTTFM